MKQLTERTYLPRLRTTPASGHSRYCYERCLHGKWIPCNQGRARALSRIYNRRGMQWKCN